MIRATHDFALPTNGDRPKVYPEDRRCLQCGCYISIYNSQDICAAHQSDRDLILTRMGR